LILTFLRGKIMLKNSSGKVLTVFLIIIAVLLISLTAVSFFFFQRETEQRKETEVALQKTKANEVKLEQDLKEVKKQNFLLEEKSKEMDEQINSLLDDLEVEKGLKEEVKRENLSLQEKLDTAINERDALRQQLTSDMTGFEEKISALNAQLETEINLKKELETVNKELQDKITELEKEVEAAKAKQGTSSQAVPVPVEGQMNSGSLDVELDKIVVVPNRAMEGRIINVDLESEFVIFNLGEKEGISLDKIMSLYRGNNYLGDIKVTSVQPQMSAADTIPPLSAKVIRKNDRVVAKQ